MYKRPLPRARNTRETRDHVNIPEGSFLYGLLNPKPTIYFKFEKGPVYNREVYVKMRILKSGIVRIKIDASIATLYEKYYSKAIRPPSKPIIQAYKSMGFSEMFLEKIKRNFAKKEKEQKRIEGVIDKLFNKKPVKKVKKKKEEEVKVDVDVDVDVELIEEEKVDEEDEEDDTPGEDDGLDVEPDPEEDVEEEPTEEEYLSD